MSAFDDFQKNPSPLNAVALAIEDQCSQVITDWVHVDELNKAKKLVEAAPDLLQALSAVVDRYAPTASSGNDDIARMWSDARAAIAKAIGA